MIFGDPQGGDSFSDRYGDPVHGISKPGGRFAVELANRLPQGTVTFLPVTYPAIGLLGNWHEIINTVGAGARIGLLGAYTGSVKDGKRALAMAIDDERRLCPKVKLVLVGYSQGAQVVGDIYQQLDAAKRAAVAGVVLFGDTYFNPADPATKGSFDPTRHGGLGTRPLLPGPVAKRVFSICHLYDPVCQGPGRDDFAQHTDYQSEQWLKTAAAQIASRFAGGGTAGKGGPGQVATCGTHNNYPIFAYNLSCTIALRYMRDSLSPTSTLPPGWTGANSDFVLDSKHAGTAMLFPIKDQATVFAAEGSNGRPVMAKLHGAPVVWWAQPYGE